MSEGNAPSMACSRCTESHSRPLAECTVDKHQVVVVDLRRPGIVAADCGRVEGEPGDELAEVAGIVRRWPRAGRGRRGAALHPDRSPAPAAAVAPGTAAPARTPQSSRVAAAIAPASRPDRRGRVPARRRQRARSSGHVRQRPGPSAVRPVASSAVRRTGVHLADAGVQSEQPVPGDLVARIRTDAQRGDEVLDVRGLDEPQPAVLHERHAPVRELELELTAVAGRAHQHRLIAQRLPFLVRGENGVRDARAPDRRRRSSVCKHRPCPPRCCRGRRAARSDARRRRSGRITLARSSSGCTERKLCSSRTTVASGTSPRDRTGASRTRRGTRTPPAHHHRPRSDRARPGRSAVTMSTWIWFTSWYSSTRT